MALLQISEPGVSSTQYQLRLAAGIDLGTTNSLIATVRSGKAEIIPDTTGCKLLPSIVSYQPTTILVGKQAKIKVEQDPTNTIISVKRLLGRQLTEIQQRYPNLPYRLTASKNGLPLIHTVRGQVDPIQVSSEILKSLVHRAEKLLNGKLDGVVITVPAYFNDMQRQGTKDAARFAGLSVLRLLNEPTAAAIAYGLDSQKEGIIAIYDLGGGTFDISILKLQHGVFEVLATAGDTALGGDDFDHLLVEFIYRQADIIDRTDYYLQSQVLNIAKQAKIALTNNSCTEIKINDWRGTLKREQLNTLIKPLIKNTLLISRRALKDAAVNINDVLQVIMVGGSTRIPLVFSMVKNFFGLKPLTSIDPDKVVAIGASIQANILIGNKPNSDLLLLDVTPLSLGLETIGGVVEKIIPRNTVLPIAKAQEFTTFKDGQTAMTFHVVQGEHEMANNCYSLARFTLRGIPPLSAGKAHIRVVFQVDMDGLLSVSVVEKSTGISSSIQIKPSYGLTNKEIANMITNSIADVPDNMG